MSNVPMTRPEELLALHETSYFHSSTFTELDDGRILHAAGTTFTTSSDGGITWSEPFERRDADGASVGGSGTSLVRLSGRGVGLLALKQNAEESRRGIHHLVFWRSPDGGETWERPVQVTPPGLPAHAYQDVLLRTSSGRIVVPVYGMLGQRAGPSDVRPPFSGKLIGGQWVSTAAHFFDPRFSFVYVCYSDDDGRTWQRNRDGELVILHDWNATYSYVNEPSVAEVSPGRLLMVMRTGLGRLFQSWSDDNGETWSRPAPTSLAATTTPAQIRSIPATGHLLLVWNQETEEEVKRGYNRTRISAAISRNGGSVWEFFQNVESIHETTRVEPGPIRPVRPAEYYFLPGVAAPEREVEYITQDATYGRWSYPSVFVGRDRVLIAHSYTTMDEHPTRAELIDSKSKPGGFSQKLKVLPLTWFYGGKEPAENPFLPRAEAPATP